MKLTPDDIAARVFSTRIVGGYSPKEVTAFLKKQRLHWMKFYKKTKILRPDCRKKKSI